MLAMGQELWGEREVSKETLLGSRVLLQPESSMAAAGKQTARIALGSLDGPLLLLGEPPPLSCPELSHPTCYYA